MKEEISMEVRKKRVNTDITKKMLNDELVNHENYVHELRIPRMLDILSKITTISVDDIVINDNLLQRFKHISIYSFLELPKFYSAYVRDDIYKKVDVDTYDELMKVEGLACGGGTWFGTGESLISENECKLCDLISSIEDIQYFLLDKGMSLDKCVKIADDVAKGKVSVGASEFWSSCDDEMWFIRGIDHWFMWLCKLITSLNDKSTIKERLDNQLKLAFYKIHYPMEYYLSLFGTDVINGVSNDDEFIKDCRSLIGIVKAANFRSRFVYHVKESDSWTDIVGIASDYAEIVNLIREYGEIERNLSIIIQLWKIQDDEDVNIMRLSLKWQDLKLIVESFDITLEGYEFFERNESPGLFNELFGKERVDY